MTRKAELTIVLEEGKRVRTKFLDVRALASPLPHPRVGIIVRKQGQTTADRNRVKRRLRELARLYLLPAAEPVDFVIRTRDEAYAASFEELRIDLLEVMKRLRRAL